MWLELLSLGIPEFKDFLARNRSKKKSIFEAVEAILSAANETTIFINKNLKTSPDPNAELSNIWMNAASKVRNLDKVLYMNLLNKSDYWSDPGSWSDEEIQKYKIALTEIKIAAKKLLEEIH